MRIRRRLPILPLLLTFAACDGGTLPPTDPIHGEWATPVSLFRGTGDIDRAEHRFTFRADGTYESTTLGFEQAGAGWLVVYEGELTGTYRLESGGVAKNVRRYRWRAAETSGWQDEVVADPESFGPPTRYTRDGDRLIMHLGPSQNEHGLPIPAQDRIYTRR
jgi:hypothetical protein